ncbi:fimbria/pilus outer membrane usher protein [Ramlibacter albus]|uniref:Fimbrial biogenesis outer membrane usher protein n=1 Tax=Ramlibacter albus TaxID=2079448 RepID=A0A923M5M7_9BURK|nr:fimbria/pilus outer membrane usher protein [Ramlibacter albus]MBC5763269.1 fimbrial biogenesis outer membrane usher protein [Ramlibacter albus]
MRLGRPTLRSLTVLLLALAGPGAALAQTPEASASPARPRERLIPFEVTINATPGGSWVLLEREGNLYAPTEAIDEWRLTRRGGVTPYVYRGKQWFPLSALPGFEVKMNLATQSLDLSFSPTAFIQSRVTEPTPAERAKTVPAEPALFLNFDTNLSYNKSNGTRAQQDLGVLGEVGWSSNWGVLTTSFVGRHLDGSDPAQPRSFHRLETVFTHNFVSSGLTLRAGDSSTRTGIVLRPTYFGGVEIGRNFGLAPGFISRPVPVIGGTAAAPSTVELYVNDALRQTSRVPVGPFVIDNYPLLTGSGQARIVVRDVLGRESVVVQSFFSTNSMLEEGLSDWHLSAGAVRRDIGSESDRYDEKFAGALWRYGFSKQLTLDANAQLGRDRQVAAAGVVAGLPLQMVGLLGVAGSRHQAGSAGQRWVLGLEHSSLRHGVSLNYTASSRGFTEFALEPGALPNAKEMSASYSYGDARFGSVGLGFARIVPYDKEPFTTYSVNYSIQFANKWSLNVSATHVKGTGGGTSVSTSLAIPLDDRVTALGVATARTGSFEGFATASKAVGPEGGFGWRVLGGTRSSGAYAEGGVSHEGSRLRTSAEASVSKDFQALRLGAEGSLVFMGGSLFATRRLQSSFALVEIPGYPNVGVGLHGRVQARTDSEGKALLPGLMPFTPNSIQIDPKELPISAEIDNIEQVVIPPERSGVRVTFPVRSGRGALIKIVFDDGEPAPAGAEIEIVGDKAEFFVARRGEAFVTGLQERNELRLKWKGASCSFAVQLPKGEVDEIARVGPLTCPGIKR